MAGYKETPRQKMIAMLYLVLTALLALNVSKQIIDAFVTVNESIESTNQNFATKVNEVYSKFEMQYQLNEAKVGPFWEKAKQAQKISLQLRQYVDSIKYIVIQKTDRYETLEEAKKVALRDVQRKDNFDVPTSFFIGSSETTKSAEGYKLQKRIEDFKMQLLALLPQEKIDLIKIGLDTKGPFHNRDGKPEDWARHNFYHTILAADVTILNRINADIYNAEYDVVSFLYGSVSAEDFKFDKIAAKVVPKSRYVFIGEEYQAEVFVAAYDTKQNPDVRYVLGVDSITDNMAKNAVPVEGKDGLVRIKFPASAEGLKKYAGVINVKSPSGIPMTFHFHDEYIVAKPTLVISPTKMNVFYVGVDNPVSIQVPGGAERTEPTISAGKIRREGLNWVVYDLPQGRKDAVITVNAVYGGKSKNMGSQTFRLKRVPDPIAYIARVHEGFISKSLLVAGGAIIPEMPAGFDFDLRFTVISFSFVSDIPGDVVTIRAQGNRLTQEMISLINQAKKNKRIWLEDIVVRGPDGERNIASINLKIN